MIKIDNLESKTMLRIYDGPQKGATSFFRNRPLLETIFDLMCESKRKHFNIFFHACSIGAEVYSFLIQYYCGKFDSQFSVSITATDLNAEFLRIAQSGTYPSVVLNDLTNREQEFFSNLGEDQIIVSDKLSKFVRFLPPTSFVEYTTQENFDLVFLLNAFTYVSPKQQEIAIQKISKYNSFLFITSCFHPDSIKRDLQKNQYQPILLNIDNIHDSWTERISTLKKPMPDTPQYSYLIPPFSKIDDYEYKYCSIFKKS